MSPSFLVKVAAIDGHEIDKKAMDDVSGDVTQRDGVLFSKG